MSREAMQQALEALEIEQAALEYEHGKVEHIENAIIALRAALAEPVQNEPLAWFRLDEKTNEAFLVYFPSADGKDWRPLYAMPRKPLTDEEIAAIASTPCAVVGSYVHTFARAIERAHGITGDSNE